MLVDQHEILQIAEKLREAVHARHKAAMLLMKAEEELNRIQEEYQATEMPVKELTKELHELIGS